MPKRVSSFPPEYLTLFDRAVGERFVVKLPTLANCISLRMKLHQLRTAMRRENPGRADAWEGVIIRQPSHTLDGKAEMVIEPRSATADEAEAFAALGITGLSPEADMSPGPAPAAPAEPPGAALEDAINTLFNSPLTGEEDL